ncbi:type II toxin-antitoxin system HicB family antitoxin [Argonema galeatum]|uniref:type II toxin-antitoxin system HicB family antitoxin n=1 Tax=Argonema galeatum TaxID=2942762 RepID=UPI002013B94C|nr:type II toxin-antitoxin system HicB family antitoxin [Argonema galeatum]MCL1466103.1 type II toxin-antitoxin system HicB family antitoxin [Argonema galeatum A003/A1]
MKLMTEYTIVLRPDDNGTFVAYIPAIPGCHAWGQTPDEARAELVNVFDMIQEEYSEQGRKLPDDVKLVIAHARRQQVIWKELLKNWVL